LQYHRTETILYLHILGNLKKRPQFFEKYLIYFWDSKVATGLKIEIGLRHEIVVGRKEKDSSVEHDSKNRIRFKGKNMIHRIE